MRKIESIFEYNVDLKNHCTMHVGGKAKIFCSPKNIKQLKAILAYAKDNNIKYYILGYGSNTIFKDEGYDGIVVSLKQLKGVRKTKSGACAMSGTSLFALNLFLKNNSLAGLEWSYGIPGCVGGAVAMNAGAYGQEICCFIEKVECIIGSKLKRLDAKKLAFSYRQSEIKDKGYVVTRVWFGLGKGDSVEIEQKQKHFFAKRKATQPLEFYNSGSIFKKIDGQSAGKIIDNLGLKSVKINGAEISSLHANFIINKGSATANDVLELIKLVQQRVYQELGITLECEVVIAN